MQGLCPTLNLCSHPGSLLLCRHVSSLSLAFLAAVLFLDAVTGHPMVGTVESKVLRGLTVLEAGVGMGGQEQCVPCGFSRRRLLEDECSG